MNTRIAGIPCIVEVTHYEPYHAGTFFEPPSGPEIEYSIYDRRGRPAAWLDGKRTENDDIAILEQHEDELRGARDEEHIDAYIDALK
ncbi:hypothetical protein [Kushneria aurantia]|uniref:Uncharacterized protein n=1 Tax=Kushneria aurantia TaxID=504092 RepID=A0ABV6G4W8_9GAMM|nr:hypothetical protein [Kushneria aurantia]